MIGVSTLTYDPAGARLFTMGGDELANEQGSRRSERTATLDGGCVVYDTGYADSDKTLIIREVNPTEEMIDFVKYIVKNYSEIVVTDRDGAFKGVPKDYDARDGALKMSILITEKISE